LASTPKQALQRYGAKRSFARTPEPPPAAAPARAGPLLFVVQKHAARRLHYDLRFELDGVLKSWAVPKGPSLNPEDKRLAVAVEDHPFDYASFEGVIPAKQYGAGSVIVWDCGLYCPDDEQRYCFDDRAAAQQRTRTGLADGKLSLFLRGTKLKGSFALVRTRKTDEWLLLKHRDRFAASVEVLEQTRSVLSGCTVEEIAQHPGEQLPARRLAPDGAHESPPRRLAPMLAEIGEVLRTDVQWRYEPKLDGYRVLAYLERGKVRLISRRGLELSGAFPEIVAELAAQAVEHMVLDGEIVALDEQGRPTFNALQNRAQLKSSAEIARAQQQTPVILVCFDLLHFAGLNLRDASYLERRRYLTQCLLPSAHIQLVHAEANAERLYEASLASGFEGVIAKRIDSRYRPGRRDSNWRKFKAVQTREFVVGGYTAGKAARSALGALLLGYWQGRRLRYAGHVGSGLSEALIGQLRARLAQLVRKQSPFSEPPPLHRPTTWLVPKLVAEVSFAEWTPDGLLRAPVFLRLRDDIDAATVRADPVAASDPPARNRVRPRKPSARQSTPSSEIEQVLQQLAQPGQRLDLAVGDARLRLTNLDRVYWPADPGTREPAIRKRDLIAYLAAVSPFMLPHLHDRPLTMIRMPEGIGGERFFQKHWEQQLPEFVQTVQIYSGHRGERQDYLLANNLPTLLWLGQVGTLEFHIWHSRIAQSGEAVVHGDDYASSAEALEQSELNFPDYLVFDIDPYIYSGHEAPGAEPELNQRGFAGGKQVAFWLRALLEQMSLKSFMKTSGKTGLHVFVPIKRTVTFDLAREICESIGRHLLREHPREITMEWAVPKRTGKIFIDYNMNVRGKTLNVAYSPRGVSGAPVSMPLAWDELEAAEPQQFTIANAMQHLERTGDRWHDLLSCKQDLAQAFDSVTRR
jgi:bifunctional non-homologous end joining protein LigD